MTSHSSRVLPASLSGAGSSPLEHLPPVHRSRASSVSLTTRQPLPRSLPPWIDSYDPRLGKATTDQLRLLSHHIPHAHTASAYRPEATTPSAPPNNPPCRRSRDGYLDWTNDASANDHLGLPKTGQSNILTFLSRILPQLRTANRGRKWDHLRSAEPVIVAGYAAGFGVRAEHGATAGAVGGGGSLTATAWNNFMHSSEYGRGGTTNRSEVIPADLFDKLQPTFNLPVQPQLSETSATAPPLGAGLGTYLLAAQRRLWRALLHHSLSPLLFRLSIMNTALIDVGLAAHLLKVTAGVGDELVRLRAQAIFAVVVDVLAVPYVGYMVWDEYTGKPLGLRSATQKTSLILMDLFFIICKSVSVALVIDGLLYSSLLLLSSQRSIVAAMAAFIMLGLLAWSLTFMMNVFRTIEQLGGGGENQARL